MDREEYLRFVAWLGERGFRSPLRQLATKHQYYDLWVRQGKPGGKETLNLAKGSKEYQDWFDTLSPWEKLRAQSPSLLGGTRDTGVDFAGLAPGAEELAAQWRPPVTEGDVDVVVVEQPEPPDIKGYVKIPFYDPTTGKIVSWTFEPDPTFSRPMSDYERRSLDLQAQTYNAQARKAYQERVDTRTWQQMLSDTARLQGQQRPYRAEAGDIQDWLAQGQAFEAQRGVGGGARNWIQQYMAENAPNPYEGRYPGAPTAIDDAQRALLRSQQANQALVGRSFADPFTGETSFGRPSPTVGYDELQISLAGQSARREKELSDLLSVQKQRSKALDYVSNPHKYEDLPLVKKHELAALGKDVMGGGGEPQAAPRPPSTPEMPNWLSQMPWHG